MKKLFISQPMRDKTKEEILAEREEAVKIAKEKLNDEVEVIDSYFEDFDRSVTNAPLWYLGKSLQLLATADAAYFANGWEQARGCKIERTCATEYGIDVV